MKYIGLEWYSYLSECTLQWSSKVETLIEILSK